MASTARHVRDNRSFVREVSSIPMVSCGLQYGSSLYHNVKKYNHYLDTTLSTTEALMMLIANAPTLQKMAQKIELPLAFVDRVAWDGLIRLEHKYPAILMEPEEIKDEALKQALVLKDAGAKKLDEVVHVVCRHRKRGMDKAFNLLESMMGPKMAVYVELIERRIDDYLPPIQKPMTNGDIVVVADNEETAEKPAVFARLFFIPRTVQQRLAERYHRMIEMTNDGELKDKGNKDDDD